jgi:hypothetical protein
MLTRVIRNYGLIQGYKTRIIDDFEEHYQWMDKNKPELAVLYFKNEWNPECSRKLMKDYLKLFQFEGFESFVIDTSTSQGERTKKYYSVRYEPTFIFLTDGFEIKKYIGGSFEDLKKNLEQIKLFRKTVKWEYGVAPGPGIWEHHHEEHMNKWDNWAKKEAYSHEGTIQFDRH